MEQSGQEALRRIGVAQIAPDLGSGLPLLVFPHPDVVTHPGRNWIEVGVKDG